METLYYDEFVLETEEEYQYTKRPSAFRAREDVSQIFDETISKLRLVDDIAFRCVMEGTRKAIAYLTSAITGKSMKAKDISHLDAQKNLQSIPLSHGVIYDAYGVTKMDDYILEIQTTDKEDLTMRIRYYLAASDTVDVMRGRPYSQLRKSPSSSTAHPTSQERRNRCMLTW